MKEFPGNLSPQKLYDFWSEECERYLPQPIRSEHTEQYLVLNEMPEVERAIILDRQKDFINHLIETLVLKKSDAARIEGTLEKILPETLHVYWWRLGTLLTFLGDQAQNNRETPVSPGWSAFLRTSLIRR
jgi:hypothetical protein